jgi:hypothetical protein
VISIVSSKFTTYVSSKTKNMQLISNDIFTTTKKIENEFKEKEFKEKDQEKEFKEKDQEKEFKEKDQEKEFKEKEKKELNESTTDESDDPDDLLNTDNKPNMMPTNNSVSMVINPDKNVQKTFIYRPYEYEPISLDKETKMPTDVLKYSSKLDSMVHYIGESPKVGKLPQRGHIGEPFDATKLLKPFDTEDNLEGFDGMTWKNYADF